VTDPTASCSGDIADMRNSSPVRMTVANPPLSDYIAFHGMLISPPSAQRCIDSFNGVVLFADQSTYDNRMDLKYFDFNRTRLPLTIWSYYVLVAFSLTGLCSLLGQTKLLTCNDAENKECRADDEKEVAVDSIEIQNLRIPTYAIRYVIQRANDLKCDSEKAVSTLQLTRRFEYNFGGFLSVMMVHFVCCNGRKHLVEVYRVENTALGVLTKVFLLPLQMIQLFFEATYAKVN
jgi:hypothetical protein